MYTITFRVPATEAERVVPVFGHVADSPVINAEGRALRPAREAGNVLSVKTTTLAVAKMIADVLKKDFDEVVITQS